MESVKKSVAPLSIILIKSRPRFKHVERDDVNKHIAVFVQHWNGSINFNEKLRKTPQTLVLLITWIFCVLAIMY